MATYVIVATSFRSKRDIEKVAKNRKEADAIFAQLQTDAPKTMGVSPVLLTMYNHRGTQIRRGFVTDDSVDSD